MRMRVLFDTNIFISYLLSRDPEKIIASIVEAAFEGEYQLLLPQEVVTELYTKLTEKKYLYGHISMQEAHDFVRVLKTVAEVIPKVTDSIPEIGRDKKDDYLLTYSVIGQADYLVSGDKDLLDLGEIEGVKIVSPTFLYKLIRKR